MAMKKT